MSIESSHPRLPGPAPQGETSGGAPPAPDELATLDPVPVEAVLVAVPVDTLLDPGKPVEVLLDVPVLVDPSPVDVTLTLVVVLPLTPPAPLPGPVPGPAPAPAPPPAPAPAVVPLASPRTTLPLQLIATSSPTHDASDGKTSRLMGPIVYRPAAA